MSGIDINLWNPENVSFITALVLSYLLGIVHGTTPDEHTWPITFSYAVGSGSTKGGMKAGLIFSAGFTIQRAILSEIAYFALAGIFMTTAIFGATYFIVGLAMAMAGLYIKRKDIYPHWHFIEERLGSFFIHGNSKVQMKKELTHRANPAVEGGKAMRPVPPNLAFVHGLIAGFGFGAFALIIYTVLAPAMPNPYLGFLPGLLFGLGTMTMQVAFGAVFGRWLASVKRLTSRGIQFVSRSISSDVLEYGGIAFMVAGILVLIYPNILNIGINTGIKVHNLDNLDIGFFLVIVSVVVIASLSYRRAIKRAENNPSYIRRTKPSVHNIA
ncbi:MAG: hypothetical protein QXF01_00640 [Candidatus Micrarchaeaceae archaeon]